MLKQRLITALIMLAIVLPTLFVKSVWPFCLLALAFMAAGAWEWGKMNGLDAVKAICYAVAFAMLASFIWSLGYLAIQLPIIWLSASVGWMIGSVYLLWRGASAWIKIPVWLRNVVGIIALLLAWLAVCQARVQGLNFLLSILCLAFAADTFAYFAGNTWGGKLSSSKLAPSISPGKSWEGAWGGFCGVVLIASLWILNDSRVQAEVTSLYTRLNAHSIAFLLLSLLFLTTMSVVGDLIESLIKRSAGVKDSSHLLPGHGGVLDRIDALLPTLPIAMMLSSLAK
jgi:phosphatidate cytidylyltransferase